MKKTCCFCLILALFLTFCGCQHDSNASEASSTDIPEQKENLLKAWTGAFSEEQLTKGIYEYQNNYANIVLEKGTDTAVSFEVDFDVASCSVSRLSKVDGKDISEELNGYVDLFVETKCDGKKVTVATDWWYKKGDSWVNDYTVWSYLVCLKDVDGNSHYYYFRTDYSAFAND